jgi:N-acetylglucosamine-6-phosphate deacetylase
MDFIHAGALRDVRFALGHSAATYEQVLAAADVGLDQATHIFNGMDGLHHRTPGTVGGILTDERIYAQVIADGIHLHPAIVKLVIQAKGVERTILISDAMRAAGMPDGTYDLGGQAISVSGGIARTAAGGLAGSTLTMDAAVRNAIKFAGVSLPQALAMASRVPAQAMGIDQAKGKIEPGADADLILFDDDLNIHLTMVMGQVVYERGAS